MNSDTSLFPSRRDIADQVWDARARSLTYRMMAGAGRAEMFAYRPGSSYTYSAMVHGFTASGDFVVAIPGDPHPAVCGEGAMVREIPSKVRVAIEKEAPHAGIQVIAASVHFLGEAEWLSEQEKGTLLQSGGMDARLAEVAAHGSLARVSFDVALLHDCCGVTRVSRDDIREECEGHIIERECGPICATEDLFAEPSTEITAVDYVLGSALMESGAAIDGLLFGEYCGAYIGRQVVAHPMAYSLGTICLDVDRTGVTLMCIEHDQATTVFLPFEVPVSTERELKRAVDRLCTGS